MVSIYNATHSNGTVVFDLESLANSSTFTTTTTGCLAGTTAPTENEESLRLVRYFVHKVCVPVVVAVGVVGNTLNMVVLTRRSMVSSTSSYLTALAAFDMLYLLCSLTLSLEHHNGFKKSPAYVYWYPNGRVLTDMAANVSVLLTVIFTVERYIGVCHPMRGKVLCTPQRAKLVTGIVALVAISLTIPEFFEREIVYERNDTTNETYPVWQYTTFSSTYSYQMGYYWFFVTAFTFLPLILLCIFNGILVASLFRAAELRTRMTLSSASPGCTSERYSREQQRITKMLVTVVLVFILCQLPGAVLLLYRTYTELAQVQLSEFQKNERLIAGNVTNLLYQINASINFILYSVISTKFRRVFCRIICDGTKGAFNRDKNLTCKSNDGMPMTSMCSASFRSNVNYQASLSGSSVRAHLLSNGRCRRNSDNVNGRCTDSGWNLTVNKPAQTSKEKRLPDSVS